MKSENLVISFPQWKEVLERDGGLTEALQASHKRAIYEYLHDCKQKGCCATVESVKEFLNQEREWCRKGLRWFFVEGKKAMSGDSVTHFGSMNTEPPPAAEDLGGPEWERALIGTIRSRSLQWRTEQTYRQWCVRFARFVSPKDPREAEEAEVRAFLEDLAVRLRVAASTQKQALNAVVFLLREAAKRELGDFSDFVRAAPSRRVPVVLTRIECARLFDAMEEETQLMAQVAYGGGLRLMELLRLRVKDVDLEKRVITVRGGKGDKDRVSVLADVLVKRLRSHLSRIRTVWETDVAGGWTACGCQRGWRGSIRMRGRSGFGSGFFRRGRQAWILGVG